MELSNGLVFCRVESGLTGTRVVSVPFSDHCTPLVRNHDELECLISKLKRECATRRGEYIELRLCESHDVPEGFSASGRFALHTLDLRPSLDELSQGLHPSCIRRRISRARREGLRYEEGRSEVLLAEFYRLAVLTRRRQHLPPQPLAWFRNLIACLTDKLKIHLLFRSDQAVAGILTTRFQNTITYKYGFSDKRYHQLGCMPLLLWKAIEDAKNEGLTQLDLGRSDCDNQGLVEFKDRWGATRSTLIYLRYPQVKARYAARLLRSGIAARVFDLAPDSFLTAAGRILYRHIG
jgi:lipid II:glycine glycyltransferase (peptidoglycan interpeptide bridge formation enzyme)